MASKNVSSLLRSSVSADNGRESMVWSSGSPVTAKTSLSRENGGSSKGVFSILRGGSNSGSIRQSKTTDFRLPLRTSIVGQNMDFNKISLLESSSSSEDSFSLEVNDRVLSFVDNEWEKRIYENVYSTYGASHFTARQMTIIAGLLETKAKHFWSEEGWITLITDAKKASEKVRIMKVSLIHNLRGIHTNLYKDFPESVNRIISQRERNMLGIWDENYGYSEFGFTGMAETLWNLVPRLSVGGNFYDLGSGSGKVVFAAAMLHDFENVVGIELLSSLNSVAKKTLEKYKASMTSNKALQTEASQIKFKHGCFIKTDWSNGDVVFVNCGSFDYELMGSLSNLAEKLKKGSHVITTTQCLISPLFRLKTSRQLDTGYG
mmetsp:Transcript_23351/g.41312  ORF Transcript_23351/g.41312 Transcript_23351/m.41312 type:complete len:376 (-) Transcript_23351:265-1392(-)